MIGGVVSFLENASTAVLPSDVGERLAGLAREYGFANTLIIDAAASRSTGAATVVYSAWRAAFMDYASTTPFGANPLVLCANALDAPFGIERARKMLGYREADIRRTLFPPMQDKHITIFPVHRRGTPVLYVACAGDKPDDSPHVRTLLHASAHATYDLIRALAPNSRLTPREAACLKLVADGNTYSGAGRVLGLAERTVRAEIASAKQKLKAKTKAELIAKAVVPTAATWSGER
jgi:DNA-binding CsgD family transcriptional regulator